MLLNDLDHIGDVDAHHQDFGSTWEVSGLLQRSNVKIYYLEIQVKEWADTKGCHDLLSLEILRENALNLKRILNEVICYLCQIVVRFVLLDLEGALHRAEDVHHGDLQMHALVENGWFFLDQLLGEIWETKFLKGFNKGLSYGAYILNSYGGEII